MTGLQGSLLDGGAIAACPQGELNGVARHDGAARRCALVLEEAKEFLERFVVFSSESQVVALALWVAHTYVLDAADVTPYVLVTSPEKQCGKTRLFEVLEELVHRPWRVEMPSEAVLFRKIDRDRPTLLLDEIDAIFNGRRDTEALRAILNASNRRGATVPRCVGEGQRLQDFETFCPKAFAGIETRRIPDTLRDRSITIRLERKVDRRVERFRHRLVAEPADSFRLAATDWATSDGALLTDSRPALPEELSDRAQDAWEPLLAIADAAREHWPEAARESSRELSVSVDTVSDSLGVQLLSDIQAIFQVAPAGRIFTKDLLERLHAYEESPWRDYSRGGGLGAHALARLLRPFGIRPQTIRLDAKTNKGYSEEAFRAAWKRYVPDAERHIVTSGAAAAHHDVGDPSR